MEINGLFAGYTPEEEHVMMRNLKRWERDYRLLSKQVAVKRVRSVLDKLIRNFLKDNPTTCKKGCAHCCYQFVYVTKDEAKSIYKYCMDNGIPIDWDMLEKQKHFDRENWTNRPKGESKCIFLDDENTCKIYPVRPMSCMKYFVASDPGDCNHFNGIKMVKILQNIEAETLCGGVYRACNPDSLPKQFFKLE